MIYVDRQHLKFLLAGRELTIQLERMPKNAYRKNRVYAVALVGNRRSTCQAQVLEVDGMKIRIRHAPDGADLPRMLQRKSGYTHHGDPLEAGEALSVVDLERYATKNRERHDAVRRADRDSLPLTDRLRDLERRAADGDQQARRHLHVIRQRVEAAEKRRSGEAA